MKKIISRLLSQTYVTSSTAGVGVVGPPFTSSTTMSSTTKMNDVNGKVVHHKGVGKQTSGGALLAISSAVSHNGYVEASSNSPPSSHHIISTTNNSNYTKCIYYLDKNATPYMTTIFKK